MQNLETDFRRFEAERKHWLVRNYLAIVCDGTFFTSAMAFVQAESILPGMAKTLGASDWFIAVLPMSLMMGYYISPLLFVHFVQKLERLLPFAFLFGFLQRIPFLFAAVVLYLWGNEYRAVGIISLMAAPFFCGLIGGVGMSAWVGMVSRCLPAKRRASNMALRALLASLLGIGVGEVVKYVLAVMPDAEGFAMLHFFAFLFLMASVAGLGFTKEPIPPQVNTEDAETETNGFIATLKLIPRLLRKDLRFRYAFLTNFTGNGYMVFVPFIAVHALKVTGRGEAFLGFLLQGQMVGMILGNALAVFVGDRLGCFRTIILTRMLFLSVAVAILFPLEGWGYFVVFLFFGCGIAGNTVVSTTLPMEVAPLSKVPLYASMLYTLNLPALSFAALLAVVSRFLMEGVLLPAGIGALLLTASTFFGIRLSRLPDPHKTF
ncbi:MAG: MFS transporter [Opitutales bacterium]|nr:MFS transporter [Opitutales bacterium]